MLKAIFNGLNGFIRGSVAGTFLGIVLTIWALDKTGFLDCKEMARFWDSQDKKRNAN